MDDEVKNEGVSNGGTKGGRGKPHIFLTLHGILVQRVHAHVYSDFSTPTDIKASSEPVADERDPYTVFAVSANLAQKLRMQGIPDPNGLYDAVEHVLALRGSIRLPLEVRP